MKHIDRFLSIAEVQKIAGNKSRVTLWRWQRLGIFPKAKKIGPNSSAFLESEVADWLESFKGE